MVKKTGISSLTALVLFALAVPEVGQAIRLPLHTQIAQVPNISRLREKFPFPEQVTADTQIKIDGSSTMVVVNDTLKQQFESDFSNTRVDIAANGTGPALEKLLNGELDLVALGRPLTQAERDRGLEQVTLEREKLAIIIGPNNPFEGNLTFTQFAQIFRGEITDWSEVGGEPGPIKFIDRPEDSDTRLAFAPYEAFRAAPFESGSTTVRVANDDTQEVIDTLGDNGISYAVASHVLGLDTVKIVPMHKTLPDNPAYPYSQPRAYAYSEPANESVKAFLGYGLADQGQTAIALAQETEAQAIASGLSLTSAVSPITNDNSAASGIGDPTSGDSSGDDSGDGAADSEETGEAIATGDGDAQTGSAGGANDGNTEGDAANAVAGGSDSSDSDSNASGDPSNEDIGNEDINGGNNAGEADSETLSQTDGDSGTADTVNGAGNETEESTPTSTDGTGSDAEEGLPIWFWWLLPLGILGLLLWGLMGRKDSEQTPDPDTPGPVTTDASLNSRTPNLDGANAGATSPVAAEKQAGDFEESAYGDDSDDSLSETDLPSETMAIPSDAGIAPEHTEANVPETNLPETNLLETNLPGIGAKAGAAIATGTALITSLSLLKSGRSHEAQASLDEAVAQNPNDDVAWILRGQTLAEAGEWDQSIASYDRALAIDPDSPVALSGKGVAFTQKGQPEVAIAFYDQALDAQKRRSTSKFVDAGLPLMGGTALTASILAAKGKALAHTGKPTEAFSTLNQATNTNPDDADVWTVKGDTLAPLEQTEAALASYDRAIERRDYSPAAYLGKARILSAIPLRTKDALSHYEWTTTLTQETDEDWQTEKQPPMPPSSIEPNLLTPLLVGGIAMAGMTGSKVLKAKSLAGQGRILVDTGQRELNQQQPPPATVKAVEIDTFAQNNLEEKLFGEELSTSAINHSVENNLEENLFGPEVSFTPETVAEINSSVKDSLEENLFGTEASYATTNTSEIDSSTESSLEENLFGTDSVETDSVEADDLDTDDFEADDLDTDNFGSDSFEANSFIAGIDGPDGTEDIDGAEASITSEGGSIPTEEDNFREEPTGQTRIEQGLAKLETAIATNPQDATLYVEQSMAFAKLGNQEAAIASMAKAESLHPDHPIVQLYKGHMLMALGQAGRALTVYKTSLNLEKEYPDAVLAKGTALDSLGHLEEAIITFNQLIDEDIAPSTTLMTQAEALGLSLLGAKALKAHALEAKGNTLISLGYTGAGIESLQQAANTDPTNPQIWISQGNALTVANRPTEAIASFDRALELDPTSTQALVGKGNGLILLNQKDEAVGVTLRHFL